MLATVRRACGGATADRKATRLARAALGVLAAARPAALLDALHITLAQAAVLVGETASIVGRSAAEFAVVTLRAGPPDDFETVTSAPLIVDLAHGLDALRNELAAGQLSKHRVVVAVDAERKAPELAAAEAAVPMFNKLLQLLEKLASDRGGALPAPGLPVQADLALEPGDDLVLLQGWLLGYPVLYALEGASANCLGGCELVVTSLFVDSPMLLAGDSEGPPGALVSFSYPAALREECEAVVSAWAENQSRLIAAAAPHLSNPRVVSTTTSLPAVAL
eukprot:m.54664 g.54664  ORF g.54664 m.54664 type:complete len:278 (-) comp6860_c0_seq2:30-863(-)